MSKVGKAPDLRVEALLSRCARLALLVTEMV